MPESWQDYLCSTVYLEQQNPYLDLPVVGCWRTDVGLLWHLSSYLDLDPHYDVGDTDV